MGLSITVGLLDDVARHDAEGLAHHRRAFARLTSALADQGIAWQEPEVGDPPAAPAVSAGFPYRYLTHLRRAFVLARFDEPVTPALGLDSAQYVRDCQRIDDETTMFDSHLLCHADDSGYYVPVDFGDPLFLDAAARVDGNGMVGSSQRLRAELASVAPALGIRLGADGALSADEESALRGLEPGTPFEMERVIWHQLHRACAASVAGGSAIVFH
jgi:hypothetical protein